MVNIDGKDNIAFLFEPFHSDCVLSLRDSSSRRCSL